MRIKLAGQICWGYRVALMSGSSRRLWNQLLRSALSFIRYLSRSALALAASQAFVRCRVYISLSLSSLYSARFLSPLRSLLPLSRFVTNTERERFIPYRMKLLGQSRRTDSAKGQQSPDPPAYIRIPLLSSYNLRQLPLTTGSIAEIGP